MRWSRWVLLGAVLISTAIGLYLFSGSSLTYSRSLGTSVSGIGIYLMPVSSGDVPCEPGDRVWDDLWPGMISDVRSREIFDRIYGGGPVDLVLERLGGKPKQVPPGETFQAVVRFDIARQEDTVSRRKGHVHGLLALSRVVVKESRGWGAIWSGKDFLSDPFHCPDDLGILLLVANEYLLRNHPGWQVFSHGLSADEVQLPEGGPAELRADLARRMAAYVEAGGMRPEGR